MDADSPDLDDTVLVAAGRPPAVPTDPEEDTVVRDREASPPPLVDPLASPGPSALVESTMPSEPPARSGRAPEATSSAEDRPPVRAFRIGDHEPIRLDVPALIGRRPSRPRILSGGTPRLVRVPSPGSEISATHLEVRQEGRTVVVTDLGSTNGTRVLSPAMPPRQLRQGESFVVTAGTVVELGDGIRIEIVPASEEAR